MPESREESDGVTPLCVGNPLAGELARLVPAPPGFDRDALLFAAGRAVQAGKTARWRWATVAAVLVAVAAWGYTQYEPDGSARVGPPASGSTDPNPTVAPPGTPVIPTESSPAPLFVTFEKEYDPGDRVRGLRLRNDILIAGLGVIPSSAVRPHAATDATWAEVEKTLGLQPGSFAIPMVPTPKKQPDEPENP